MITLEPNPDCLTPPGNESKMHFYLKQLGKVFLKFKYSCKYIGAEVFLGKSIDTSHKEKWERLPYNERTRTDVVGVEERKLKHMDHEGVIRNIEVKVSRADYKDGYCVMGDYNYIMSPKGMLKKSDLPSPIGFIEVDTDNVDIRHDKKKNRLHMKGVELKKYPKRLNDSTYIVGSHKDYVDWVKDNILSKQTNNDVYRNLWVYWD